MKPSIAADLTELTPASLVALEDCSEASVCAPGYIQPHGILLVLQESTLEILQISENVEQILGISAAALLGQPIQQLFSRTQTSRIADLLQKDNSERNNPFELNVSVNISRTVHPELRDTHHQSPSTQGQGSRRRRKAQTFRGMLHRTPPTVILELEPQTVREKTASIQFYHRLQSAIFTLRSTSHLSDLTQTLAREVRAITGFDRVMVYRFEADGHGVVIAEEKVSHLDSYLGLHYPATDIPAASRQLFYRNWIRQIPDINHTPAQLIPAPSPDSPSPDLSDCALRGVHPGHIEYLQNMGVAASLAISLIDDKRLWGLIACHHYSPRKVDYEIRKTCEFLGQFASIELVHRQERELSSYHTQIKVIQDNLQRSFLHDPHFIEQVLTCSQEQLINLVHAQGAALLLDEHLTLVGSTPTANDVKELIEWLVQHNQDRVFATDKLSKIYPPAKQFKQYASGILAISIVLSSTKPKSYHIIWFRPEQVQTVNWAGNPQDAITIDQLGQLRLCPRKSFELWKETVREMSYPWQNTELEAAAEMRNTLMLAVLEFSQSALEQAAERAALANRAKSQFLAKMSHELRTPLNAILGFTQVMNHSPNTPKEFQEHLSIINRSGEYLLTLVNDVLEMSRIEAGQLILTENYFNLHHLLRSLHELFALKAAQKGLTLSFEEDQGVPCHICSDEAKLRQILINLLSNAIKFTIEGKVTVRVRANPAETAMQDCTCSPTAPPPCRPYILSFEVEDTGCGIDSRDWESVFEAFMQTEQGRHAQGTGLGLSISRQFARLMGGDITVQSTLNQGSTFTCQIRIRQPESIALVQPETTRLVIGLEAGQPTYRILVAEDVPENRQLLKMILEPIGFEVHTVADGAEAIAQWQVVQPHLILMDIQMPVVDGYEATKQIREAGQRNTNGKEDGGDVRTSLPSPPLPKIIALTAYAFEADRVASLQSGCDDYITKPFTEATLFETIARHLNVHYRYSDRVISARENVTQRTLTRQDLSIMPMEWREQVYEAALDLNDGRIRVLIAQIPSQEEWLLQGMTFLIDNFQLEVIATLTQP